MKKKNFLSALTLTVLFAAAGCGHDDNTPPPQAMAPRPAPAPVHKTWTKADKIAAIEKAPIPDAQKKVEIAKVNSGAD